jgi:hypothetical protein
MAIQITQSYSIRLVLFIKNVKNEKKSLRLRNQYNVRMFISLVYRVGYNFQKFY